MPPKCLNTTLIGAHCNASAALCDILQPCESSGNCTNDNSAAYGYTCVCRAGFTGSQCEQDHRPCKPDSCLNHGEIIHSVLTRFIHRRYLFAHRSLQRNIERRSSLYLRLWLGRDTLSNTSKLLRQRGLPKRWCLSPAADELHL